MSPDPWAHARIDALQRVLADMLTDLAIADIPLEQRMPTKDISVALKMFADADEAVEKKLGLR
jgi:hypothetical protein